MNCNEFRKITEANNDVSDEVEAEASAHTELCQACREWEDGWFDGLQQRGLVEIASTPGHLRLSDRDIPVGLQDLLSGVPSF